jgi:hypothetical protein
MAGLDRATEPGFKGLSFWNEVVGNLGVDSDRAAVDQVRLVAVGFGGGEGGGLEQVRAADHLNFLHGSGFGDGGVEHDHSAGVGEVGERRNLGQIAGNFQGAGVVLGEVDHRVGGR